MPRKQSTYESLVILLIIVTEIEEGVAVVAVDAEVPARAKLQASAGMPAELGCVDAHIGPFDRLHAAAIPAGPGQEEGGNAAAGQAQEQGRLYRGLGDLLVDELERRGFGDGREIADVPVRARGATEPFLSLDQSSEFPPARREIQSCECTHRPGRVRLVADEVVGNHGDRRDC